MADSARIAEGGRHRNHLRELVELHHDVYYLLLYHCINTLVRFVGVLASPLAPSVLLCDLFVAHGRGAFFVFKLYDCLSFISKCSTAGRLQDCNLVRVGVVFCIGDPAVETISVTDSDMGLYASLSFLYKIESS